MGRKKKYNRKKTGKSRITRLPVTQITQINWILLGLIILLTAMVYLPSFNNEFTNWDDPTYVSENPYLSSISGEKIKEIFSKPIAHNYHPLTIISLAINYEISGMDPWSYFAGNIILHLLNMALVFFFIFYLTKGRQEIALLVAFLFGIHPMHVESVSWIAERKDVLYSLFFLGGMISYVRYIQIQKNSLYWIALALALLSMFSKPAAVTFPLILILIYYFLKPQIKTGHVVKTIPFFILAFIFGGLTIWAQTYGQAVVGDYNDFNLIERGVIACYGFIIYIFKMFIPIQLSAYHPTPDSLPYYFYIFPVLVGALAFWAWKTRKKTRVVLFGLLFYAVNIALVLQIVSVGHAIIAERYTYIPYIGLFLIIGHWMFKATESRRWSKSAAQALAGLIILAGLVFAYLSYERTAVWKNSEALWTDVIEKYPEEAIGYNSRGNYYKSIGQADRAFADYNVAIQYAEDHKPYVNRGIIYHERGKYELALADYNKGIEISPGNAQAYYNRGNTYLSLGRLELALKDINKSIAIQPLFQSYYGRAIYHTRKGNLQEAINDYTRSIHLNPYYAATYSQRGKLYYQTRQYQAAILDYQTALQLSPNNASYQSMLNKAKQAIK